MICHITFGNDTPLRDTNASILDVSSSTGSCLNPPNGVETTVKSSCLCPCQAYFSVCSRPRSVHCLRIDLAVVSHWPPCQVLAFLIDDKSRARQGKCLTRFCPDGFTFCHFDIFMEIESALVVLRQPKGLLASPYGVWFHVDLSNETFHLRSGTPCCPKAKRESNKDSCHKFLCPTRCCIFMNQFWAFFLESFLVGLRLLVNLCCTSSFCNFSPNSVALFNEIWRKCSMAFCFPLFLIH